MNHIQNNVSPHMTKIIRVPMRHTFTVEQKMTLLRYFENGMLGQSMAYHDKIIQCAQESGLDFEVVKNWVGNQRRKRRMEEMQSVCVNQEQIVGPVSPQSASGKHPRLVRSPVGLQRPSQVLYFPRSSGAPVNLPGKPVNTLAACHSGPQHSDIRDVENQHMQYSPQFAHASPTESAQRVNVNHPQITFSGHHNEGGQLHVSASPPQLPPGQLNPRDFQASRSIPSSSNTPLGHGPRLLMNNKCRFVVQQPPPGTSSMAHVNNTLRPPSSVGHPHDSIDLPTSVHHQSGGLHSQTHSHVVPNSSDYGTPQIGQVSQDGRYYFSEAPSQRPSRYPANIDRGSVIEEESEIEWRETQIQKIMETIQVYVDQLSKLGCEAFLASVSKDNFATYLCGTPLGNNYFTKVNRDLPLAEFVEKILRAKGSAEEEEKETDNSQEELNSSAVSELEEKDSEETEMGKEEKEEVLEVKVNCGNDDSEEAQNVIKEGEEVYIVNKENYVIGKGTLLSAPFEKITPRIVPKDDNEDEDGFIEDKSS